MRAKIIALAVGMGLCLATALAHADVEKRSYGDNWSTYEFKDELLNSNIGGANAAIIRVRPPASRVSLIRPRTNFVAEMLKSVEKM